jgi:two-component system, NtrC family, sensor kinase
MTLAMMDKEQVAQPAKEEKGQLTAQARDLEAKVQERTLLLQRAKRDWEATFDAMSTPVALVRRDRTVLRANRAYARVAGVEVRNVPGRVCHQVLLGRATPCAACPLDDAFAGSPRSVEIVGRNGSMLRVRAFNSPEATEQVAACVYEDVTAEREQKRRLMLAEKMSAIGRLAGSVAHEINNPLGAILAFSQIMQREGGRSTEDAEALKLIEESALRCKRIVGSLLTFSRRAPLQRVLMDVRQAIDDACLLFRTQLNAHPRATLAVRIAPDLPEILGDRTHLEQALHNILENALQSLPEGVGSIEVVAEAREAGLVLTVSDSGCGILESDLPHIFEPSFTTKPPAEGTGLGLAVVYGIIEEHGGRIDVVSTLGKGSTFTITLPRFEESTAST